MPLPAQIPRLKKALAREYIRSRVESWIVGGQLRPEEVIDDKEIAHSFGVSRMPVREALRSLEDAGLIETALNRWTRVAPLHAENAQSIYEVVGLLAVLALEKAFPHFTNDDFAVMKRALNDLEDAITAGDPVKATQADAHFHSVWISRSGNSELERILKGSKARLTRIEREYFRDAADMRESLAEHHRIFGALEKQNIEGALLMLKEHWRSSVTRCMKRVRGESMS